MKLTDIVCLTEITPVVAENILTYHNDNNRKMKQVTVTKYRMAMKNSKWNTTDLPEGARFVFDKTGRLLSGQHRLRAAVMANYTITNVTIDVVDKELWLDHTIERRTANDRVKMRFPGFSDLEIKLGIAIAGQTYQLDGYLRDEAPSRDEAYYISTSGTPNPEKRFMQVMNRIRPQLQTLINKFGGDHQRKLIALGCLLYLDPTILPRLLAMIQVDSIVFRYMPGKGGLVQCFAGYQHWLLTNEPLEDFPEGREVVIELLE